jgi:hypothetical protein
MKHYINMRSIKAVSHELVLKIYSLTAAALISLQHILLLVQRVHLVWHNTILHMWKAYHNEFNPQDKNFQVQKIVQHFPISWAHGSVVG